MKISTNPKSQVAFDRMAIHLQGVCCSITRGLLFDMRMVQERDSLVRWLAQAQGSCKLNVDGAANGKPDPEEIGGVIHKDGGRMILMFCELVDVWDLNREGSADVVSGSGSELAKLGDGREERMGKRK